MALAFTTFFLFLFILIVATGWMLYYYWWTYYGLPTDYSPFVFQFFGWQNFIVAATTFEELPAEASPFTWFLYNPLWVLLIIWFFFGDDPEFETYVWWWFYFYYWLYYFNFGNATELTAANNTLSLYSLNAASAVNAAQTKHPAAQGKLLQHLSSHHYSSSASTASPFISSASNNTEKIFDMLQDLAPHRIMTSDWMSENMHRTPPELFKMLIPFLANTRALRICHKPVNVSDIHFDANSKKPTLPVGVNQTSILQHFRKSFALGRNDPVFLDFVARCKNELNSSLHADPMKMRRNQTVLNRENSFNAISAPSSSSSYSSAAVPPPSSHVQPISLAQQASTLSRRTSLQQDYQPGVFTHTPPHHLSSLQHTYDYSSPSHAHINNLNPRCNHPSASPSFAPSSSSNQSRTSNRNNSMNTTNFYDLYSGSVDDDDQRHTYPKNAVAHHLPVQPSISNAAQTSRRQYEELQQQIAQKGTRNDSQSSRQGINIATIRQTSNSNTSQRKLSQASSPISTETISISDHLPKDVTSNIIVDPSLEMNITTSFTYDDDIVDNNDQHDGGDGDGDDDNGRRLSHHQQH